MSTTYADADAALGRIRANRAALAAATAPLDEQIRALQDQRATVAGAFEATITEDEAVVAACLREHASEFAAAARSRKLVHGTIGFRSGGVRAVCVQGEEHTIHMSQVLRIDEVVETVARLQRGKLKDLSPEQRAAIGVQLVQTESSYYRLTDGRLVALGGADE